MYQRKVWRASCSTPCCAPWGVCAVGAVDGRGVTGLLEGRPFRFPGLVPSATGKLIAFSGASSTVWLASVSS